MTPCEEVILKTIRKLSNEKGETSNIRRVASHAYVSEEHTRFCLRPNGELLKFIDKVILPGKSARLIIKHKEDKNHDDHCGLGYDAGRIVRRER